ncbi:MAG: hypothetical protein JW720_02540 [Sedimentisphaerales bacterium]|nr:hypothetical protein [Sedimentisphaerales bacterium]
MPLNQKSIAVSFAVASFFAVSIVAWLSGLTPFVCCKRAITAAIIAYLAAALAVKAANAIVISAMAQSQIRQHKERNSGTAN